MTKEEQQKIIKKCAESERVLLATRERMERINVPATSEANKTIAYERAKLIGIMEVMKVLGVPTNKLKWVYNI